MTEVADSAFEAVARAASIAALRSAVSSRSPSGATITTCSTAPLRASNFAASTSVAFCASEPGIENLFSSVPFSGPNARNEITKKNSRPPMTVRFGWVAWARAMRASVPVCWRASAPLDGSVMGLSSCTYPVGGTGAPPVKICDPQRQLRSGTRATAPPKGRD